MLTEYPESGLTGCKLVGGREDLAATKAATKAPKATTPHGITIARIPPVERPDELFLW